MSRLVLKAQEQSVAVAVEEEEAAAAGAAEEAAEEAAAVGRLLLPGLPRSRQAPAAAGPRTFGQVAEGADP